MGAANAVQSWPPSLTAGNVSEQTFAPSLPLIREHRCQICGKLHPESLTFQCLLVDFSQVQSRARYIDGKSWEPVVGLRRV